MIADLMNFLEGRTEAIVSRLRVQMEQAAEELRFERAAALRDQIQAIDRIVERQKVVSQDYVDSDVIAMARLDNEACVQVFFIRGGKLIGREYFLMEGAENSDDAGVLSSFLKQFYDQVPIVPERVLLPREIDELQVMQEWLNTRRGGEKVMIQVPRQGAQQELVEMATENARVTLESLKAQWDKDTNRQAQSLADLHEALALPRLPNRIECYDISNTQGTAAVGSMVVFEQGVPKKNLYRRFNIRSVTGPDDFASMEEVLTRRMARWQSSQEAAAPGYKPDPSFSILPDLLMVDGGKGQLARAIKVLDKFGLTERVALISLAKQQEEIFVPGRPESIMLPRQSQGLFLVQRIRDEAHRFAITSHRLRRDKIGIASQLDKVPGVGPTRRKALLAHFGSLDAIRDATIEEILQVPGINRQVAQSIRQQLE